MRKETSSYIEVLILSSWEKGDTIENTEDGHFWLGNRDFEVPAGIKVDTLSKQLKMKSQNHLPPWEICYLLGPIL